MSALQPPLGGDESHQSGLIAMEVICVVVAGLCVALRCYFRLYHTHSFGWDDYMILIALAFSIAQAVVYISLYQFGIGRHVYYLPDPETTLPKVALWTLIETVLIIIGTNMVKVSMLIFVLRIQNSKRLKYVLWSAIWIMFAVNLGTVITLLAQCTPLQKLWNPSIPGYCLPESSVHAGSYVQSAFAIVTDLLCTTTPFIVLRNIRISKRRKFAIWGLMALGLLATVCNALRNVWVYTLSSTDMTWDSFPLTIVANLEMYIGIVCACLPTFMPLVDNKFVKGAWSQTVSSVARGFTHTYRGTADSLYSGESHSTARPPLRYSGERTTFVDTPPKPYYRSANDLELDPVSN